MDYLWVAIHLLVFLHFTLHFNKYIKSILSPLNDSVKCRIMNFPSICSIPQLGNLLENVYCYLKINYYLHFWLEVNFSTAHTLKLEDEQSNYYRSPFLQEGLNKNLLHIVSQILKDKITLTLQK